MLIIPMKPIPAKVMSTIPIPSCARMPRLNLIRRTPPSIPGLNPCVEPHKIPAYYGVSVKKVCHGPDGQERAEGDGVLGGLAQKEHYGEPDEGPGKGAGEERKEDPLPALKGPYHCQELNAPPAHALGARKELVDRGDDQEHRSSHYYPYGRVDDPRGGQKKGGRETDGYTGQTYDVGDRGSSRRSG